VQPQRNFSQRAAKMKRLCTCLAVLPLLATVLLGQQAVAPKRQFQLKDESPQFWKLIAHDAKLEVLASGFGFTEGPVWDPGGFLYVSDEELNKIFRVYLDGRKETLVSLGDQDGNTYDQQHRLVDCASVLRAIIRISSDGKYTILADRFEEKKFNSPNDVVLGPDGALYFTDPTLDLVKGEKQELPYQGVFRLDASGRVSLLTKELSQPNGLAFSPDGKKFYVDDSKQRNIAFTIFVRMARSSTATSSAKSPEAGATAFPTESRSIAMEISTSRVRKESGYGTPKDVTSELSLCQNNLRILPGEMRTLELCTLPRQLRCTNFARRHTGLCRTCPPRTEFARAKNLSGASLCIRDRRFS
jgi:hypothetical protein